jgi:hypothetical protein
MFLEFIQHMRTPAPPHIKALRFVYGAIAIEARHKRCKDSWAPHLENTKQAIRDFVKGKSYRTAYIFGSGGLHDVPLQALLSVSKEVQLIDIIHLKRIRNEMAAHPNVRIVTHDVTGLAKPFFHWLKSSDGTKPPRPTDPGHLTSSLKPGPEDLVISLNLVSQLPMGFQTTAKKANRELPDDYGHQIIKKHIARVNALPGDTLIISDYEFIDYEDGEEPKTSDATLGNLGLLPAPDKNWIWNIVPLGEISKTYHSDHRVGVWGSHKN